MVKDNDPVMSKQYPGSMYEIANLNHTSVSNGRTGMDGANLHHAGYTHGVATGAEPDDLTELRLMLPQWIECNEEQAACYRCWAAKERELGWEVAAKRIEGAAERIASCNQELIASQKALEYGLDQRRFFDQAAASWDAEEIDETLTRLREIIAEFDIEPGVKVLDLGCGTGVLFPILLETTNGAGCIVGLDFSGKMLRRAWSKGYPVEYTQADAGYLPFQDGIFDWVICNAVFPHFSDKSRALAEIRRVLNNGGRLVICHTDGRQAINELHRSLGGVVIHDMIPPEGEMRQLLREAGLVKTVVHAELDRYIVLAYRPEKVA